MAKYEKKHVPNQKLLKTLGETIRTIRKQKKLTIEQLSEKSGVNFKYLQRCETAKSNPSISILIAIAKGLDIPVEKLISKANKK